MSCRGGTVKVVADAAVVMRMRAARQEGKAATVSCPQYTTRVPTTQRELRDGKLEWRIDTRID